MFPANLSREAPKCCAWQHQGGGPRNALGHRPEPEVLPLPAETSREAPKCCAWQHQGGGGPNQVLRLAASREGGTVQSLKCCPCQQKRAARLPSAAPALPAEPSREAPKCCAWQHQERGPRNALGHRPEPEVLPLPAETSREAPSVRLLCVCLVRLPLGHRERRAP